MRARLSLDFTVHGARFRMVFMLLGRQLDLCWWTFLHGYDLLAEPRVRVTQFMYIQERRVGRVARAPVHARRAGQTEQRTAYAADERKGCQAATSRLESTRSSEASASPGLC